MHKRPLPKHEPITKGNCAKCGLEFSMPYLHISRLNGKPALLCTECLREKNEAEKEAENEEI